jgi:hypothetical protein
MLIRDDEAKGHAMTPQQASDIIEQLALGTDPRTGGTLPDGDACTSLEVIRALFIARDALRGPVPAAKPPRAAVMRDGVVVPNAGKKWSGDDVATLMRHFEAGTPIAEIATQLGRTKGSIISRLVQAGVLPDREAGYALAGGRQRVADGQEQGGTAP